MFLVLLGGVLGVLIRTEGAVLDPALYLLPSPPLVSSSDNISPGERWKMVEATRVTREADPDPNTELSTTTEKTETMEVADTFWSGLRTPAYGIRGIHIPLTFSITGTYGNSGYGSYGTGVVGSSYASITNDGASSFGNYGKSALAGSSYGTYPGVRVFGGGSKTGWSGWGNGKWGHYGKG